MDTSVFNVHHRINSYAIFFLIPLNYIRVHTCTQYIYTLKLDIYCYVEMLIINTKTIRSLMLHQGQKLDFCPTQDTHTCYHLKMYDTSKRHF